MKLQPSSEPGVALEIVTANPSGQGPHPGDYDVEGGLAPIVVDSTANAGLYEEPSVWHRHPF